MKDSLHLSGARAAHDPFTYEYRLRFADIALALASGSDAGPRNAILDRAVAGNVSVTTV